MTHFNTNKETGDTLKESERKADTQGEKILKYFKMHVADCAGPSDIWLKAFDCLIPLTSVRRAMTCLTNDGELMKTERMQSGAYGKTEHMWRRRPVVCGELF